MQFSASSAQAKYKVYQTLMKKRCWLASFIALFVIVSVGRFVSARTNPFPDVVFLERETGGNRLFYEFTPVLAKDHSVILGPTHSAEDGVLRFYDWDGDGQKEAVVETTNWTLNALDLRYRGKHVMKYGWNEKNGKPMFTTIFTELKSDMDEWERQNAETGR